MALCVLVLAPAWLQLRSYALQNASSIKVQRRADAGQGAELDRLIAAVKRRGGGRVYAGMPSNWGTSFTVGAVPVFKYLESRDVDEVGYTLRTASLMTDPEFYFDQEDAADYRLFGVRYVIYPTGEQPPVATTMLQRAGDYALWSIGGVGYVSVGRIVGVTAANRTNVGLRSVPLLRSQLAAHGAYVRVAFGGDGRAGGLPPDPAGGVAGVVVSQTADLEAGEASATVRMRHAGVAVLSASFDPGWSATVDGHVVRTEMVAPALVAVPVGAGIHRLVFRYRGYGGYPFLFGLAALALVSLTVVDRRRKAAGRPDGGVGSSYAG
jgi:hypothetical protein